MHAATRFRTLFRTRAGRLLRLAPADRHAYIDVYATFTVLFMSVVISIRIPREVKEILEEGEININEEVKRFLEELAWRVKIRKFVSKWDELLKDLKPSEKGFSVRSVREDRESH